MFSKFVLLAFVALPCHLFAIGQDTDYEETEVWGKEKKDSYEAECMGKYFNCLIGSNSTIERFIQAQKKCCVNKLNDSQDIWFVTFNYCVYRETSRIVKICLFKSGFRCMIRIANYMERIFSDFMQFQKDVSDRIQPRPTTAEECNDSFIMNYSNALKEQCKDNTNKNLDPVCNCTTNVFQEHKTIM
nr:hypothetical protein F6W77_19425 [Acinetobacter baumannii]